jgi:hypothetical protein
MNFFELLDTLHGKKLDEHRVSLPPWVRNEAQRQDNETDDSLRERMKRLFAEATGSVFDVAEELEHPLSKSDLAKEVRKRKV